MQLDSKMGRTSRAKSISRLGAAGKRFNCSGVSRAWAVRPKPSPITANNEQKVFTTIHWNYFADAFCITVSIWIGTGTNWRTSSPLVVS